MFWTKWGLFLISAIVLVALGGLAFQAGISVGAGHVVGVAPAVVGPGYYGFHPFFFFPFRSEERRVGKECRL